MRTIGIDLASRPENTGVCIVEWGERATVSIPAGRPDDERLLRLRSECDATGIDAPFGWPLAFRRLLDGEMPDGEWSEACLALRYRATDLRVKREVGWFPLSVSSDLIAVPAMRCARLLAVMGVGDLTGRDGVFEVYPAAALRRWELTACRGYKGRAGAHVRAPLVEELIARVPLAVDNGIADRLKASDHAFDALLAALVARAAVRGLTDTPSGAGADTAHSEGWIHMPKPGSLANLLG